jgi:hypothetical protein
MIQIDYALSKDTLLEVFKEAEETANANADLFIQSHKDELTKVFKSATQSYREVLLGCTLVHLLYPEADLTKPYANHGGNSYNGRTLAESVISPVLDEKYIPCTRNPYLAVFRRSVSFVEDTAAGMRDKEGYHAFTALLDLIQKTNDYSVVKDQLIAILRLFIKIRDDALIPLARLNRVSMGQFKLLLKKLIVCKSGGLLPVLLTVAFFQTLAEYYTVPWEITYQGINVADRATGEGGDITIKASGKTYLAIEVTERIIGEDRVRATFNHKIIHNDIKDYLFVYTKRLPEAKAFEVASSYFPQGYDINLVGLEELIASSFQAMKADARTIFTGKMLQILSASNISSIAKVSWNNSVASLVGVNI